MATCKRCGWRRAVIDTAWVQDTIYDNGVGAYVETERPCPDCKGTGEVESDDSKRGVAGDYCASGNECGRLGCPECQQ